MSRPKADVTPADRIGFWKKLWGTPQRMTQDATDLAFEEFQDEFVPRHMHKAFLKTFGAPKAKFNNRFFSDDAVYQNWNTRLEQLAPGEQGKAEVIVIYGSTERLEAHLLHGELRRSLRDVIMDDWHPACAIIRTSRATLYLFVEPKMRGCLIKTVKHQRDAEPTEEPDDIE